MSIILYEYFYVFINFLFSLTRYDRRRLMSTHAQTHSHHRRLDRYKIKIFDYKTVVPRVSRDQKNTKLFRKKHCCRDRSDAVTLTLLIHTIRIIILIVTNVSYSYIRR